MVPPAKQYFISELSNGTQRTRIVELDRKRNYSLTYGIYIFAKAISRLNESFPKYMTKNKKQVEELREKLRALSSTAKANSMRRYFPQGIHCIGVTAADINATVASFRTEYKQLSATEVLLITEDVLKNAEYAEEILVAFGLINHLVKNHYDDDLLLRFRYWFEHYTSNWAQVDDLCLKTLYKYLLARPHLIEQTQPWSRSSVSWCKRASNVVWVKFIRRRIGSSLYMLEKQLVFENCDRLIHDTDEFVQKSVGWLLKVTSLHHQADVIEYIKNNQDLMQRSTVRYALEKVDKDIRKTLLSEFKSL